MQVRVATRAWLAAVAAGTAIVLPWTALADASHHATADAGGGLPFDEAGPSTSPVSIAGTSSASGVTRDWDVQTRPGEMESQCAIDASGLGQNIASVRGTAETLYDDLLIETDDLSPGASFTVTINFDFFASFGPESVGQTLQDPGVVLTIPGIFIGSYSRGGGGLGGFASLPLGLSEIDFTGPNALQLSLGVFNGTPATFEAILQTTASVSQSGQTASTAIAGFRPGFPVVEPQNPAIEITVDSDQGGIVDNTFGPVPLPISPVLPWVAIGLIAVLLARRPLLLPR